MVRSAKKILRAHASSEDARRAVTKSSRTKVPIQYRTLTNGTVSGMKSTGE